MEYCSNYCLRYNYSLEHCSNQSTHLFLTKRLREGRNRYSSPLPFLLKVRGCALWFVWVCVYDGGLYSLLVVPVLIHHRLPLLPFHLNVPTSTSSTASSTTTTAAISSSLIFSLAVRSGPSRSDRVVGRSGRLLTRRTSPPLTPCCTWSPRTTTTMTRR
jgi:hypothetical protein